jgi:7,8-dihydropterin-6-yl-methyl-4-(beta-D-ribofuranosyl)aminobenzene 5'-phosphate synthase
MLRFRLPKSLVLAALAFSCTISALAAGHPVKTLKLTILSTMLADSGGARGSGGAPDLLGEWGFSALLESDGHKILIDTGAHPDTVLHNAHALGIDLCDVNDVVLTHFHPDHISGLMTLRQSCMAAHPQAFSRVYVATGIFWSHPVANQAGVIREYNPMIAIRKQYEATGGVFIEHSGPAEIYPGIWLTGPVPRTFPEHNYASTGTVITPAGPVPDTVPDDQSVLVETAHGTVVVTGCGHAGAINIVTDAEKIIPNQKIYAIAGGLHLYNATAKTVDWTGDQLKLAGVQYLIGAHCTGIEALYTLRTRIGLTRQTAVVGAVGATFVLNEGIHPGEIAQ